MQCKVLPLRVSASNDFSWRAYSRFQPRSLHRVGSQAVYREHLMLLLGVLDGRIARVRLLLISSVEAC